MSNTTNLPLRAYAHIGDAVYELFVREKTVMLTAKAEKIHKITVALVNGEFQSLLLEKLDEFLSADEKELARRARNLPVTTARRTNQALHRLSTAFEVVVGYLHLNNKQRLTELFEFIMPFIQDKLAEKGFEVQL